MMHAPQDARPMVRWWWFGPAVSKDEIRREIDQMHAGGIGGFELASVYPLALDDDANGIHNLRYASQEMVDMLRTAQQHGRALGMRVDLTVGSGWPFGGPHISVENAAGRLKLVLLPLPVRNPPVLEAGEHVIAAFTADGRPDLWQADTAKRVLLNPGNSLATANFPQATATPRVALIFLASHTGQTVKRAAVGGEDYVLDHMSRTAIDVHNRAVSEKLLAGFQGAPPTTIFSDSLEVYGSDWTATLPGEFRQRRGYDLIPHLPELWQGGTPQADAVRHDWGVTLSDLVRENYLKPMADFARAHRTKFRSQTYGEPAATLSDEEAPQLAEGEGPQWNAFSFTRWASSANHVFGRNITSAETWTWLHSPAFRATPLDMKVEADRMFLEGVNQIVGHGWPYSPPSALEPGYSLYAAAVFNAHNPWWPIMPSVTLYLQRVSWLLRQGDPANDVAMLLPEDDAQAAFRPGHVSVTEYMKEHITPGLTQAVLSAGHNLDYIDGPAIERLGATQRCLIVPPTTRMRLATAQALERYVAGGGKVLFIGTLPRLAGGLQDSADTPALQASIERLRTHAVQVSATALTAELRGMMAADFDTAPTNGAVGFLHRRLRSADIYFVANTSQEVQRFPLKVSSTHRSLEWWDVEAGTVRPAAAGEIVTLPPYGSRVLVAGSRPAARRSMTQQDRVLASRTVDHWSAEFPGSAASPAAPKVGDASPIWSDSASTKFYSGEVRYSTHFTVSPRRGTLLRFAPGKPLASAQPTNKPGTRAWFEAPVREAATVLVNGKTVGVLWHPPYDLDLTAATRSGNNTLEVRVYNTAINALAGQPPRDYSTLNAKYGDRFQMQDMDHLQPVTSGIVGPVEIVTTTLKKTH